MFFGIAICVIQTFTHSTKHPRDAFRQRCSNGCDLASGVVESAHFVLVHAFL